MLMRLLDYTLYDLKKKFFIQISIYLNYDVITLGKVFNLLT